MKNISGYNNSDMRSLNEKVTLGACLMAFWFMIHTISTKNKHVKLRLVYVSFILAAIVYSTVFS